MSRRLGIEWWLMLAEKRLHALLNRHGIPFYQMADPLGGPDGPRPSLLTVSELAESHLKRLYDSVFDEFLEGLEPPIPTEKLNRPPLPTARRRVIIFASHPGGSHERRGCWIGGVGFGQNPLWRTGERPGGLGRLFFPIRRGSSRTSNWSALWGGTFPARTWTCCADGKSTCRACKPSTGDTFRWSGYYENDLNEAKTLDTRLNVFERFSPDLPAGHRAADAVFLANIDPDLQLRVLRQVRRPKIIAADTMNLWIATKPHRLKALCKEIDILILNDGEARQFSGKPSLIQAGRTIRAWGPRFVVVKKGEHGALLFSKSGVYAAPAFPLEEVFDPTGAGRHLCRRVHGLLEPPRQPPRRGVPAPGPFLRHGHGEFHR
jgi:hypothetical protein